jgi:uncharacterized membrane protein YphA (DoxX/SURF4 family)
MLDETSRRNTLVPLVLRLALAAIFLYHGWDKVAGKGNDLGALWAENLWRQQSKVPQGVVVRLDNLAEDLTKEGKETEAAEVKKIEARLQTSYEEDARLPPESVTFPGAQLAVAWGELICGFTLLLGLLTRLSALLMIVIQVGAIATVTWGRGFSSLQGLGYEYNLVIIAACLAVAFTGGGLLSLDYCIRHWRARRAGAGAAPAATQPPTPVGV